MSTILDILAWAVITLAVLVVTLSVRYLIANPGGPKYYLRLYDAIAAAYILGLYILLATDVITVSNLGAMLARIGFIVLLGLFAAEIVASNGYSNHHHRPGRAADRR